MKKKIFTLLTLLLAVCSGAWADDDVIFSYTLADQNNPSSEGWTDRTASGSIGGTISFYYKMDGNTIKGALGYSTSSGYYYNMNGDAASVRLTLSGENKFQAGDIVEATFASNNTSNSRTIRVRTAKGSSTNQVESESTITKAAKTVTLTSAFDDLSTIFVERNGGLNIYAVRVLRPAAEVASAPTFSPNGGAVNGGTTVTLGSSAIYTYYQWSDTEQTFTKDSEGWTEGTSVDVPNVTATKYLYAYASNGSGYESDVVYKTFNITKVQLANELAYATTAVTKVAGEASFTNTLTNPNNLSVTYSVADGATATGVSVDATTGEVTIGDVSGTAVIKAAFAGDDDYLAGEVSYTLTVAALVAQTDVTGDKTWDIENNVHSSVDANTNNTWRTYANISGLTFDEAFDATSLLVKASTSNTAYRKQYLCAQGATLKFHTTVPGFVQVVYSSPSSSARGLSINGTEKESTLAKKTSAQYYVPAGDVEITGIGSIRIFKIVFTVNATITPAYAKTTYVTDGPMDFSSVSGLKAYVATSASGDGVTMTEEGAVPAATPLLLIGTAETPYSVPVAASATAPTTNLLKAGDGTTVFDGTTYDYILYSDGLFYQIGSGTVATNKAYLHLESNPAGARKLEIILDDDNTTGISVAKRIMDNSQVVYDLQGRRVAQPTKGLYIVNSKTVVVK